MLFGEYLNWFTLFSINKEHAFQIKNGNEWISVSSVLILIGNIVKKRYPKLFNLYLETATWVSSIY